MDDQRPLFNDASASVPLPADLQLDYIDRHLLKLTDEIMKRDPWCKQMTGAVREDVAGTIFADLRGQVDMWLRYIDDYEGCPP